MTVSPLLVSTTLPYKTIVVIRVFSPSFATLYVSHSSQFFSATLPGPPGAWIWVISVFLSVPFIQLSRRIYRLVVLDPEGLKHDAEWNIVRPVNATIKSQKARECIFCASSKHKNEIYTLLLPFHSMLP
jgi:hypothetical protein